MNHVYLGLGSNLGNREENLNNAIHYLASHDLIDVRKISSFYDTKAKYKIQQPNFLNAVVMVQTILSPDELLIYTQEIEKKLGRTSKGSYDPRPIDLDILFYDSIIISEDHLIIPHPLIHERKFVLEPLQEIEPDLMHPILQETISQLYRSFVGY